MSEDFRPEDGDLRSGSDPYGLSYVQDWADALAEGDLDLMLAFYADKAVLVPTFGAGILRGKDEIGEYFAKLFLLPNLSCDLEGSEINQNLQNGVRVISGNYIFVWGTCVSDMGREEARYTFVIEGDSAGWVAHTHHSSTGPE